MTRKLIASLVLTSLATVACFQPAPPGDTAVAASPASSRKLVGHMDLAGGPLRPFQPTEPVTLSFRFQFDGEAGPVSGYDLEHAKLMHAIIIRDDLSTFAHVHPSFDGSRATFDLPLHQSTNDFDNQFAAGALPAPGKYFVFTEVRPRGDFYTHHDRFAVEVAGEAKTTPLVESPRNVDGDYLQFFTIDSRPARMGDAGYRVRLKVSRRDTPGDRIQYFYFETQYGEPPPANSIGAKAEYKDVRNFRSWLTMPGHAVLAGAEGPIEKRVFRHMHSLGKTPMESKPGPVMACIVDTKPIGPTMLFALPDVEIPEPGLYKVWAQFLHEGRILTFPFVVKI